MLAPVRRLLALVAVSLGCSSSPDPAPAAVVTAKQRFLTDAQGRALILRGINVDNHAKGDPQRMPKISDEEIAMLSRDFGFDHVRLLVFWDAAEPEKGRWDDAYYDRVAAQVERFWKAGLYVVLDMHQDVYGPAVSGDGAPAWATRTDGQPFKLQKIWSANYFEPAVQRAFDNFWSNEGANADLQDHYAETWRRFAARFAKHPGVLGYDVINEPFPGSQVDIAEILFRRTQEGVGKSQTFDEGEFAQFYQRMIDAIRKDDPDKWIFFEPRYGAPANGMGSWIPRLRDPRTGTPHLVYAPHLYSVPFEANESYDPVGDEIFTLWEARRNEELAVLDCPLWIGEWGFAWGWPNAQTYGARILAMADRRMEGWAYWSWDPGTPGSWSLYDRGDATTGRPAGLTPAGITVVRPYPRAIAGEPVSFGFDPATRTFQLSFRDQPGATGPTEIFVPRARLYPTSITIACDDGAPTCTHSWDPKRSDVLLVMTTPRATGHTVRISPGG